MTVNHLHPGEIGVIAGFTEDINIDPRLLEMGLLPGSVIRMIKQAPFGGPVELKIKDYYLSLRVEDSAKIIVKKKI